MERVKNFREIATLFLRLGATAFGGPAAHLVRMQQEFVERRSWLTHQEFLDLVGAANLLPGPGSTQVAMALGYRRGGWLGLTIAGCCFILPASLATLLLAILYSHYGALPLTQSILYGARPVMVAILFQASFQLGKTALRKWHLALVALLSLIAAAFQIQPLLILVLAGGVLFGATLFQMRTFTKNRSNKNSATKSSALWLSTLPALMPASATLTSLFLIFLKLGVIVFGSGYVLLAFLRSDLVLHLHWITDAQLYDAVTAGQLTPGPLFATATFLGYIIHGNLGALIATVAIFLPSFFMAGVIGALAPKIRSSKLAGSFLSGVTAAAVALMIFVGYQLANTALIDRWTIAIALISTLLLLRFRLNATWLILGSALIGVWIQH